MLPLGSRIVYDDKLGQWRVLFDGRLVKQVFKTNSEAFKHLQDLRESKAKPEY